MVTISRRAMLALPVAAVYGYGQSTGYVTDQQPPPGLKPARNLSAAQRKENFEALWSAIDETYSFFQVKSIDWGEVHRRYRKRLDTVESDDDFYRLLFQLVNELKDTHSWLQNYSVPRPQFGPGLAVDLFSGRAYVVSVRPGSESAALGIEPGSEVVAVDGIPPAQKMEAARAFLPGRSSERAFARDACRCLLAGERDTSVAVALRAADGRDASFTLKREGPVGRPQALSRIPCEVTRQRYLHYGIHPSGLGYIRMESLNSHQDVADEFDRALAAVRRTPALILDIRDNPGGFGQPHIVGRLLRKRTLVDIGYRKDGPGHNRFTRRDSYLGPEGPWQYGAPAALLINDVTGSAADLFACWLRSARRVTLIGATTHGNLSGIAAFAVLPCGLEVRISNGYVCDAWNHPVEVAGNVPDIAVETGIADFLAGRDPVMERAVAGAAEVRPLTR